MTAGSIILRLLVLPALLALGASGRPALADGPDGRVRSAACTALASLDLPSTRIVSADAIVGSGGDKRDLPSDLPPFCRVVAQVRGAPDSDIVVEVWLPLERWTGVFHGVGNGGFGGVLAGGYGAMAEGLRRGYATATTDTGTAPATPLAGDALIGHPRKWRDWGRLSTHVMTLTGKAMSRAFYGRDARLAFYTGCSTGGQQGLIEALHYPADYDGVLVGAPVINRTWGHAAVLWDYMAAHRTPDAALSPAELDLLNRASIVRCGRRGYGLAGDPFIADPLSCRFDPAELACAEGENGRCLTAAQVATARSFYSGPTGRDGRARFYGWLPGSEGPGRYGWSFLQGGEQDAGPPFASLFRWVLGRDWDWRQFDVDRDMRRVDALLGTVVNDATRGTLARFTQRGGKLIIYHGLADTLVPPGQSLDFFQRQRTMSGDGALFDRSARLFLAPGMMHCAGGSGPDVLQSAGSQRVPVQDTAHDLFRALVAWREHGTAPEAVIATRYADVGSGAISMQRPVCAFPRQARYTGRGSIATAGNFICAPPRPS